MAFALVLVVLQVIASAVLLARLARGRDRRAPVPPMEEPPPGAEPVSIVVPTLNEARRIAPLLAGLRAQGPLVREIVMVDSGSTDATRELVHAAAAADPRIRLEEDPPLPAGWIGKAWALQHGTTIARGPWVLGLDADTSPHPALAASVVAAAMAHRYEVVSFAPRFAGQRALERWLQPAMLTTLVYRNGPAGDDVPPDRVMANGQCFLARRDVLLAHGGYAPVRASFAEDVSLARHLARRGVRVGFLDGRRLYDVRAYESAAQMWREWGRSIDLKDAASPARQALDVLFLVLVQGLPLPIVLAAALGAFRGAAGAALVGVGVALLALRWLVAYVLAPSYERRGAPFWLSPLADPLAVLRVAISSVRRPRRWRTRSYGGTGRPTRHQEEPT